MNKEWNVYFDGSYVGTVFASDESEARCGTLSKFANDDDDRELSVSPR